MPAHRTRVAATTERWFAHAATVTATNDLSPGLRHVTLDVPDLAGKHWEPDRDIEFRVSEREFRHYTAMSIDPITGAGGLATAAPLVPGLEVIPAASACPPDDHHQGLLGEWVEGPMRDDYANCVNERLLPSGSRNHATWEPPGAVHTPRSS